MQTTGNTSIKSKAAS